jgi:glycosyltransferase involved in cell wall biosynthesis
MAILHSFLFQPHPAYRAQVGHLGGLQEHRVVEAVAHNELEHARWSGQGARRRNLRAAWVARFFRPEPGGILYVAGTFPKFAHGLARFRIHVDADDPLSVLGSGGRGEIPEPSFRRQAVSLMDAIARGDLTLNFWSDIQLRTFLANLRFDESEQSLRSGRLLVVPPAIAPAQDMRDVLGSAKHLRLIAIATGKFWGKGIPDVIAACDHAIQGGVKLELTLIGGGIPVGPWLSYVSSRSWIRNLGRITRPQVETELAHADAMIFPSHHDTYGWAIIEAKRYGVPAIATDFYSRPEIVTQDVDGILLPEPFGNPFMPYREVQYAEAHLGFSANGQLIIGDAIEDYVRGLVEAIRRLYEDRSHLVALGENARAATVGNGRFAIGPRLAKLSSILGD